MEASYDDADDDNDADDDEEDDDGNDDGMLMSLSDEYTSTKRLPSRTLRLFFLISYALSVFVFSSLLWN